MDGSVWDSVVVVVLGAVAAVLGLAVLFTALVVIPKDRRPSSATAWIITIFFVPVVGLVVYFFIGNPHLPRARRVKQRSIDRLITQRTREYDLDEDDPSAAWIERSTALKANAQRLADRRFDALRLHGPGTDLTIGLFQSAHWAAGDLETVDGRRHSPNLPTEEVFTTPDPERVDGQHPLPALPHLHRPAPKQVKGAGSPVAACASRTAPASADAGGSPSNRAWW